MRQKIEGHRQMGEIFDGAIREGQFRKAKLVFFGNYPENRPIRKPVILNCHRLEAEIDNCVIDAAKTFFEDLLEWLQVGGVVGRTKKLRLEYYGKYKPLLAFLNGLKEVFYLIRLIKFFNFLAFSK